MSEIKRIGIIDDGQLGRMLTEAAIPMGFEVAALGMAGPNSPAAQVGARQIEGSIQDAAAIDRLISESDVVTWAIEHINAEYLKKREQAGFASVQPSPASLLTIQNKWTQKQHLMRAGIPVAPMALLNAHADYMASQEQWTGMMVKTTTGGFDGRGNMLAGEGTSWFDVLKKFTLPNGQIPQLYGEKLVPFQRELAVVGARDLAGRIALYPVVETVHKDNICHEVFAPADIDPKTLQLAQELGRATIETFNGAGIFAVEMFHAEEEELLVNEVAPRVHNSGHFSIIGSETSQFEQHIRAITGMPLGDTAMRAPFAAMVNILGTKDQPLSAEALAVQAGPNAEINWYGKDPRPARKIGHITVVGDSREDTIAQARALRSQIDV